MVKPPLIAPPGFPWMSHELDAQYIINPGTSSAVFDALVIGFRHTVKF